MMQVRISEVSETQSLLMLILANELRDLTGARSGDLLAMFCEMEQETLQQLREDLALAVQYCPGKLG
jgi:hypothetical protein